MFAADGVILDLSGEEG
ncbi:hypothetical protein D047_1021A, partial [Vibrio parahaemolyticus VPTS-2010_2]